MNMQNAKYERIDQTKYEYANYEYAKHEKTTLSLFLLPHANIQICNITLFKMTSDKGDEE